MKKLRIMLIILAAGLSAVPATGQNFTLSDVGLMSLDWIMGNRTAILLEKTDVPGPGVRFVIEYQGNEPQDQGFDYVSHEDHGAGSLTGIDVSIYDYYQLKFTLLSIDGDTNQDTSAVLGVGAVIGPYDDHSSAYDPEGLDFDPGPDYDTTAISSTPVRLDNTPSLLGFVAYLPWLDQWSPSGTTVTILVEAVPGAVALPKLPAIYYVDADAPPVGDGSSWARAFRCLQDALAVAENGDEIRVAQGAYSPEGPLLDIRQASNPNPANGATGVSRTAELSWTAGSDATSHDVYFGTTSPPPFMQNQTGTTSDPGTMAYSTVYYWCIDEVGAYGTITGTVWSFRTAGSGPSSTPPVGDSNEQAIPAVIDREATFQLKSGVVIKGGYAGFGEPNADARDIETYKTILSGDLLDNDEPNFVNYEENSYHVVTGSGTDATAVLDGFTITAGNANGPQWDPRNGGGGMFCIEGSPTIINCTFSRNWAVFGGGVWNLSPGRKPEFTKCIFSLNSADWDGGGMFSLGTSHILTDCTFSGNSAGNWGGGIYYYDGSPKLTKCTFSANSAGDGGGIYNDSRYTTLIINCTFKSNTAENNGGGMYNEFSFPKLTNCVLSGNLSACGAGMYNNQSSFSTLTNCIISNNSASLETAIGGPVGGSGIYNDNGSGSELTSCIISGNWTRYAGTICNGYRGLSGLINCTVSGNRALSAAGICTLDKGIASLRNCILWSNTADEDNYQIMGSAIVTYTDIQGGYPGEGNINSDPCFVQLGYWVDANDPNISTEPSDPNAVWVEGDYHLLQTSACINTANNNSLPADTQDLDGDGDSTEPIPFDIEGNPRIVYDVVDMGAYEFENTAPIADAGPDQIVECACDTEESTKVTLDGTNSSDPDRGVLSYTWTGPFVESPVYGATPIVTLEGGCPGDFVITLVVNDGIDESGPNDVMITVVDTTPPEFELSVSPTMLWPPDHKMVEITPSWTVSDDCVPTPDVSLVSIVANEGDDTIGDGHTSNDIQIGEDGSIYLRSERSGTGSDRIYTITYQAIDDYGNTTVRSATVSIPHDFRVLARIADRWLWAGTGRIPEDLNGDGVVNLKDIAIFANNWIQ